MRRLIERVFSDHLETPCHRLTVASLERTIDAYQARSTAHRTIGYLRPILKWGRVRKITGLDGSLLGLPKGTNVRRQRVLFEDELGRARRAA